MSREGLSMEDKKVFKLPLAIRIKATRLVLRQWIETTEYIFQRNMNRNEKSKVKWFFPIKEQLKALADGRKKNKLELRSTLEYMNGKNNKERNKKQYKQTAIQCCRPQGG